MQTDVFSTWLIYIFIVAQNKNNNNKLSTTTTLKLFNFCFLMFIFLLIFIRYCDDVKRHDVVWKIYRLKNIQKKSFVLSLKLCWILYVNILKNLSRMILQFIEKMLWMWSNFHIAYEEMFWRHNVDPLTSFLLHWNFT